MNQTIKIIVIAVSAAVVGGGLVIGGMKLAGGSSKSAKTTQGTGNFWDTVPENNQAAGQQGAGFGAPQQGAGVGTGTAPRGTAPQATAPQGGAGVGTAPKPTATQPQGQANTGGSDIDAQLRAMLTSSAWCSFSYKGSSTYTGGYGDSTSSSRVVFYPNGTVTSSSSSETYNSGGNGNYYGNGGGDTSGNWKIQGSQLYLSSPETGGQWVNANASLTQNSNGYPIITAGGVEYSMCN